MQLHRIISNHFGLAEGQPYFGVEIEVENVTHPINLEGTGWSTVGDGSLRDSGVEFLSARPWTRDELRRNVSTFYRWKDTSGWTTGVRTSTHVHYNVLFKTAGELAAVGTVYSLVEPILFRYVGQLREENIYCVPWYRATQELEFVRELDEGNFARVGSACKYSALFLEPITRFGTVEFRQAPVFESADDLLMWCELVERVVENGFGSVDEVLNCFDEIGADAFVRGIFGRELSEALERYCDMPFEELLDHYDVQTTAEMALACTYKPTEWLRPELGIEGNGTARYHAVENMVRGRFIEPDPDYYEPEYEQYPEEDEY